MGVTIRAFLDTEICIVPSASKPLKLSLVNVTFISGEKQKSVQNNYHDKLKNTVEKFIVEESDNCKVSLIVM